MYMNANQSRLLATAGARIAMQREFVQDVLGLG